MSLPNIEEAAKARHEKQQEVRPDAPHRALIFILNAIKAQNRDLAREVNHHIAAVDQYFRIDPQQAAAIDKETAGDPAAVDAASVDPKAPKDPPPAANGEGTAPALSSRFSR